MSGKVHTLRRPSLHPHSGTPSRTSVLSRMLREIDAELAEEAAARTRKGTEGAMPRDRGEPEGEERTRSSARFAFD